jgi:hypothetical protein
VHEWEENNNEPQGIRAMTLARPSHLHGSALLLALWLASDWAYAAPPEKITVGTVELTYCNTDYLGYCGSIKRKLDRVAPSAATS